ncbi:hypothetical protein CCC_04144 [Paramagnetospirillum magnetotacticum MS-1]|uniref:Uncharacterized protein n=1 Tax=Paramagnetospirillum magnetotacticum MS-1 TaxID=272627 RepID=A0A0C2YW77_PARME|nr:hypothetical protein [Paramagnetospirillum magnetotacticum]KIL99373.1 hypothetical protein CCC_04144 [Paramagnetospirillum magnetotacticum MS-1]
MRIRGHSDVFLMGNKGDSFSMISAYEGLIRQEVEKFPANQVLATPEDDLLGYLIQKYTLDVPTFKADEAYIERQGETQIDVSHRFDYGFHDGRGGQHVPGHEVVIGVPHTGDPDLFHVRGSTFTMSPPRISVENGTVILRFSDVKLDGERIKADMNRLIKDINAHLGYLRSDFDAWNRRMPSFARQVLANRKQRLMEQHNIVAGIGLPMKRRPDDALTYAAPEVRKRINLTPPPVPKQPFKPEPVLEIAEFEHILEVIGRLAVMLERSPSTFAKFGEEELRDSILVPLNSHYDSVTGETFNAAGKTDILIRSGERNVFIGECKFWHGEKGYLATIDQLLSYLTWRDTKAAIIIFNRNKNFSEVLVTIRAATEKHPSFKRALPAASPTSYRYVFCQNTDDVRELHLAVLVFDIPTPA